MAVKGPSDPDAKNLRYIWLPALEWYYSERVRQLTYDWEGDENCPRIQRHAPERRGGEGGADLASSSSARATPLALRSLRLAVPSPGSRSCSLASMCQKEEKAPGGEPTRTALEDGLFRALSSLDVIYAHKMLASLLSTRLPNGVVLDRG